MRGLTSLAWVLAGLLVSSCGGHGEVGFDPRRGPTNPNTPARCPIDPDCFASGVCDYGCPTFWVCEDLETMGKRCWNPSPFPDGSGGWTCTESAGVVTCTGSDFPAAGGGSGWDCTMMGEQVVCTQTPPSYPDAGHGWTCYFAGDFRVCDSDTPSSPGTPPPPGTPPGGPPPGSPPPEGPYDCTLGADGAIDCGGGTDVPAGGTEVCAEPDPSVVPMDVASSLGTIAYGSYTFGRFMGVDSAYVRFAFTQAFVDNTYGVNSSDGWRRQHTFDQLLRSDHAVFTMTDGTGATVLQFALDYLGTDSTAPSGYRCLGVESGMQSDGRMIVGDSSAILHATTSLDRNLNQRGCVYTVDSPTPAECPDWDPQVVYEMFIRLDAFGPGGVGGPAIGEVHASPSKLEDAGLPFVPAPCP